MLRAGVRDVMFAAFPDLVEQERAGLVGTAIQIVLQTAFFLARRGDEGTQFGLEKEVLAFFGAKSDDESEGAFGKFGDFGAARLAARAPLGGFFRFSFGHRRGFYSKWK